MVSGVYQILNRLNGKFYIGSSKNITTRMYRHEMFLKNNNHENPRLQASWNKHGSDAFDFIPLSFCSIEELLQKEQYFIDIFRPEYNINLIAGKPPCLKGKLWSEERKTKLKQFLKENRRSISQEGKLNMSKAKKGKSIYNASHVNRRKVVLQLDKKGLTILREFPSVVDAARFINPQKVKSIKDSISRCAIGAPKRITASGYKWKYKE